MSDTNEYQIPINENTDITDCPEKPYYDNLEISNETEASKISTPDDEYCLEDTGKDIEGEEKITEKEIINEQKFLLKSFIIFISQLLLTICLISLSFLDIVKKIMKENSTLKFSLLTIFSLGTVIILVTFTFYKKTAKETPINYIFLFNFTLCMSYFCLCISIWYKTLIVIQALSLIILATVGPIVYVCIKKNNFTYLGFFLSFLCSYAPFAGLCFIWTKEYVVFSITIGGILCYFLYLIYDITSILKELEKEYQVNDYISSGLKFYLDIIYLILTIIITILIIAANSKNDNDD